MILGSLRQNGKVDVSGLSKWFESNDVDFNTGRVVVSVLSFFSPTKKTSNETILLNLCDQFGRCKCIELCFETLLMFDLTR